MERLFGIVAATGWLLLLSVLWLGAVALLGLLLLQQQFAFNPLLTASWQMLAAGFQRGQAIPLSFILQCLLLLFLGLLGETALLWRLPAIVARLPALALPRLSFRLPRLPKPRPKARPEKPTAPPPAPSPTPAPPPPLKVEEKPQTNDPAILARILALFDVWDEPPPSWMAEALRDEIHLLSPDAWPTLESLGSHGLDLLVTLQEHGMLPESPVALKAIGEVETVLRAGLAAEAGQPETPAPMPLLTLAASWLCEALENFLSAQQDDRLPEEQLTMAQTMLEQAMRGMNEADWASLDLFPEKASRVRVLTDRLREDMRKPAPAKPPIEEGTMAPPAVAALDPIEAVLALLGRFGFSVEGGAPDAPLLAQRPDLFLLLQTIDLHQKSWRLPQGLLGPWSNAETETWPGRQLWQLLARRRLRHTDSRPLAGLLILHGGKIEEEQVLAQLVAADRRRSAIGLAWFDEKEAALPDLERELQDLTDRAARERHLRHAEGHTSAQP
jgi:hypothetical protein